MSLPDILEASAVLENANKVALGISHAYNTPPEQLFDFPVALRFAEETQQMEASDLLGRYNLYNFKIEVHFARGVLQDSYATAMACIRAYQNLYMNNLTIGGTCDVCGFRKPACTPPSFLRYGPGKVESEGVVFYMWAKEMLDDITVALAGGGVTDYKKGLLKKTGQTTQYGGYEDDGFWEKGLPESYTVFTTGQYAGTTAITLNAKTDNHSNNCVLDNVTGRMWSRYVSASVGPGNDGRLPWTTNGSGEGIFPYVEVANAAELAGYNDWRVLDKTELESLGNMEAPTAVPDVAAFPGWPALQLWTSTTRPDATTQATYVHFLPGVNGTSLKTISYYCALVRDA